MSTEAQMDVERYGFNSGDMPDCFIPENFHEVFQRIGIHGTKPRWNKRTGELETPHHVEGGVTAEDYIQIAAAVITAPDAIVAHDQDGGETRFYTKEIDGQSWVAVIPEHIIPGRRDPTMFPLLEDSPQSYFKKKMSSRWMENPRVLFDCCVDLTIPKRVLDARREAETQKVNITPAPIKGAKQINEIRSQQPVHPEPVPAAQPVAPTNADEQSTSVPVAFQTPSGMAPSSVGPQKSVPAEHEVNSTSLESASVGDTTSSNISVSNSPTSTNESISPGSNQQISNESAAQPAMVSTPLDGEVTEANLQSRAHIDKSGDHHRSAVASSQSVAESATSHDVETSGVDTADINAVEATDESLSSSGLTSQEAGSVSDATFNSSDAGSIEAFEMDTPGTDELSDAGEDSLDAGDQSAAVDVSSAEQAAPGEEEYAEGVSDLETDAPSADDDESPSALDVVAYEAVKSGEISLDSIPSEDDVGAEDVASEEDNGELGPDFLSGDEPAAVDQVAVAESVNGVDSAADVASEAEMGDGNEVAIEDEAGLEADVVTESETDEDALSLDLSPQSADKTAAEIDDGSLGVDEQAAVEDVAALEDTASVEDDGDIDLDAALSAEPATEDQLGAVDGNDDELDFVSEAEVAELEASPSDSDAALDDATDLQGELLAADDTDVYDVAESPLAVTDVPADEEALSDGTADAGDELEFVSETEIAELGASLSDSNAALDDDFMSEDEQANMAVQDSPSTLDGTSDLQDDFLDADDTSSVDTVDDDFLSMDDLAVDEEDLSYSAVDAGDELGFDEPADVGLDADNDGLDIDTDATDIDADDDIDSDDDDDVSESGDFSL